MDPVGPNSRSVFALYFAPRAFHCVGAAGVDSALSIFRNCLTDGKGFAAAAVDFLASSGYGSG